MKLKSFIRACAVLLAAQLAPAASGADLVVSAAASLANAFTDIGRAFESAHPGTRVSFNFGASGQLLQQIDKGAPVDVFASADQETMDLAAKKDLIDARTRENFARNALVVAVPLDSGGALASLGQLATKEFRRVAVGNPDSVPVGRYAKAALSASGLWSVLQPKLVNTQNVRQSLDYVARGEVDAAFVYRTDAAIAPAKIRVALEVPTQAPILYPIAVVKGTANSAAATGFAAFVRQPSARGILQQYGFQAP